MLKAIEGMTQVTNQAVRNRIHERWLHVYFFSQLAIEEGVLSIQLRYLPLTNRHNDKESLDNSHFSNKSKGLLVVTTVLLLETTLHNTSLIMPKRAPSEF